MKNNTKHIAAMIAGLIIPAALSAATDGVSVHHLGVNNTLVRVDKDHGRYLMLPVQDGSDETAVNVLVDGKLDKTINVRLAKSKVDYTVPLDLEPYRGHDVVLNIITSQGRSSVREAKGDAAWHNITLSDTIDTRNREKYRPAYHHTPLWGWMNDPNGMFYKDGVWHLAYQWNPYGSKWQNLSWGQATSRDLLHWEDQHVAALEPDGLGMIFSGSSAVDTTGSAGFGKDAVVAMYTSAAASQIQSLGHLDTDGKTYIPYAGNPVLPLESEARDPNMFWDEARGQWVLLLAHALDHEMLVFTSPDLKEWTLQSSFGKGLGAQDGVWECPDLYELTVDGTDTKKWVLVCNLNPGGPFGGSATQYFIGDFDGKTFTVDTDADGNVPTKWMDFGKDHYATVSFSNAPDARRTLIGWMSNWQYAAEVPTMQFRSANTLPREAGLFQGPDGQVYHSSTPSPEVLGLRDVLVKETRRGTLGKNITKVMLPRQNDGICEVLVDIDAQRAQDVVLTFANASGEQAVIAYNPREHTLSFDRSHAGISDFSQDFPCVTTCPTFETTGKISLRIFVDRSSFEVFGDNGRFVMTNLVFPTTPYTTLTMNANGGNARYSNLKVYSLKPSVN